MPVAMSNSTVGQKASPVGMDQGEARAPCAMFKRNPVNPEAARLAGIYVPMILDILRGRGGTRHAVETAIDLAKNSEGKTWEGAVREHKAENGYQPDKLDLDALEDLPL